MNINARISSQEYLSLLDKVKKSGWDGLTHQEYMLLHQHKRRVRQQALAVLRRAKDAGMSKQYMRIKKEVFRPLLCDSYYGGGDKASKVADCIYEHPMDAMKKPFVVIDGGDVYSRKIAGSAILFRFIGCDKIGLQETAATLARNFQTFVTDGVGRNDYLSDLLNPDVLFIMEFHSGLLRTEGMGGGDFFDDLLGKREEDGKVTIISFQVPIPGKQIVDSSGELKDMRYGQYLCMLSMADKKKMERDNIFRIRMKINE